MAGNTADLELSYYIDPVTGQVVWVTPAGTLGTLNAHEITLSASITSTLDASSSNTPVTYQLTMMSNPLPMGLYLDTSGEITGTPTPIMPADYNRPYSFTVEATDMQSNTAVQQFSYYIPTQFDFNVSPN